MARAAAAGSSMGYPSAGSSGATTAIETKPPPHRSSSTCPEAMQTMTAAAGAVIRTDSPTKTLIRRPGMLRLEYLRKMLLYALLCLLAKAVAANPCFGFAMQYCQLRMPNALVVFAKAFRWHKPSEALFFSFI